MTEPTPAPRVCAGTLFTRGDTVLLLHRSIYENGWDIPGALVGHGESPAAAARRQLGEDLGLDREPAGLVVVDWVPGDDGDEFLYVFDGGELADDDIRLTLGRNGLDRSEWVPVDRLAEYLPPELAARFTVAHAAPETLNLERGKPAGNG
ncbi:NUDIX domain-containing protein [Amycolatopsis solani]|uniref:NUDIX domain-containing protein n=1 Tax=Amycolatopsis solani TaxID=3028615 RepID=UPI0025B23719|nr:NUDIX domain-containing protein [Amycolatopsis sp. MEP2-6]